MLFYGGYGGYHGYGYGYSPYGYGHRGMLVNENDCVPGCPMQAFCDYGICRCRSGYDARYGKCWKDIDTFNNNDWSERKSAGFDPYKSCSSNDVCKDTDMNMECKDGKCQCREDLKWNDEALECQIFMDVNCTDVDTKTIIEEPDKDKKEFKFDDTEIFNTTDASGKVNVSEITADETLATSELAELNPNTTSKDDMRKAFCRDVARVARSYESNLVVPVKDDGRSGGGMSWSTLILIFIALIAVGYIGVTLYKKKCQGGRARSRSRSNSKSSSDHGGGPPPTEMYPQTAAYPPAYPPMQDDPGLPPPGPAIPPTQPGYPAVPADLNGAPAYPPAPGAAPSPPAPVGPPPYEAQAPYPPYPAAPAAGAPPYPPQPAYNPTS